MREPPRQLRYRDFLIVTLILKKKDLFPDNWIYIHSPEVKVGRIQNFRSWSEEMVPDAEHSSIGMEYFCNEGDELWDQERRGAPRPGGAGAAHAEPGRRRRSASTARSSGSRRPIRSTTSIIAMRCAPSASGCDNFPNLQVVGRNGMHRYNNQDHSMLTAMLAVKNILGEKHDLWSVNVEQEYHEEAKSRSEGATRAPRIFRAAPADAESWQKPELAVREPVSVIVPAYNAEATISRVPEGAPGGDAARRTN